MLVVAPTNVRGADLEHGFDAGFKLSGAMELRDGEWLKATGEADLELRWYHDAETGLSHDEILASHPLKAMEQLNFCSAETNLKCGNFGLVVNMLRDFPVLFDVLGFELTHINFHLKALFMGFKGESEAEKHAIYVDSLDLRESLKAEPGMDGINLYALLYRLVSNMVGPVLHEVNLTDSVTTILEGITAGLLSTSQVKSLA
jgi:hypothetical protein